MTRLLGTARLVTLAGPGGVGKTRLALQVGTDVSRSFKDGVWFVEVGDLAAPDLVAENVVSALRLNDPGQAAEAILIAFLGSRRALLVLDNCEHLLDACAVLVDHLLHACPDLRVLTTSREPLQLLGEQTVNVLPLPVPALSRTYSTQGERPAGAEYASVELFAQRASARGHHFVITESNRAVVGEICYRLDGIPLAIELAAGRIRALSVEQILARLSDSYRLLSGGNRSAPERQRTLQASLQWSYELCIPAERALWAQASVFWGGFELDAAEGICSAPELGPTDVLDVVQSLVAKSVLVREDSHGAVRYRMLETVRSYGREMLEDRGETFALRLRHRDWFEGFMMQAEADILSPRQVRWLDRVRAEEANIQAALDFSLTEPGQAEAALGLCAPLGGLLWALGRGVKVRQWLARTLEHTSESTAARAIALGQQAYLLATTGPDLPSARQTLQEGREIAALLDDEEIHANLDIVDAVIASAGGDPPAAEIAAIRGLDRLNSGSGAFVRLALLSALGSIYGTQQRFADLRAVNENIMALTVPTGEYFFRSYALRALALAALDDGDLPLASRLARLGLRMKYELDEHLGLAQALQSLAYIAASEDRFDRAANLLGAGERIWRDANATDWEPVNTTLRTACEQECSQALGAPAYAAAVRRGSAMTTASAVAYALEERAAPEPGTTKETHSPLTAREREIAALVAEGLTNKEIAARLVIAQRTAEGHVERILTKLGVSSRTRIAAWVMAEAKSSSRSEGPR